MRIAPVEVLGFPRISRTREETTRCASERRGRAGRRAPRRKGAASAHLGLLEPLGLLVLLQHAHHTAVGDLIRKREAETGLGEVVSATDGCGDCAQRPSRAFGTRARGGGRRRDSASVRARETRLRRSLPPSRRRRTRGGRTLARTTPRRRRCARASRMRTPYPKATSRARRVAGRRTLLTRDPAKRP